MDIPALGLELEIGEGIRTELSHKFTEQSARAALEEAYLDLAIARRC